MPALIPREYAIADVTESAAMGLPAREHGLLLCTDERGKRVTLVGDADYVRMVRDAPDEARAGVEIPADVFPLRRDGWPDEW